MLVVFLLGDVNLIRIKKAEHDRMRFCFFGFLVFKKTKYRVKIQLFFAAFYGHADV
jgi:hypothetical protein